MHYPVKKLPLEDRPRERLAKYGADLLSTFELLAIVIGSGTKGKSVLSLAQEILSNFGSLDKIADKTIEELCTLKGLGTVKAIQLKAALSLAARLNERSLIDHKEIRTPHDAFLQIKKLFIGKKKEMLGALLLNARNYPITQAIITVGILTQTLVHPREIFAFAIAHHAASIILVHNHPSGDPTPSKRDLDITESLLSASQIIGIPIVDHLVIGGITYSSMRECGLVFE